MEKVFSIYMKICIRTYKSHYCLSVSSATSTGAFTQDLVHMRFADVLLMHSELAETTNGINRVCSRARLNPIGSYSLNALKQERRFEA